VTDRNERPVSATWRIPDGDDVGDDLVSGQRLRILQQAPRDL
jgi:hypothetical protein